MTSTTIIVMVSILGFVWGGLVLILVTAAREERRKEAADVTPS